MCEREKEISCQFRRKVRVCRGGRVRLTEKAELIDSTEYAELRERREDSELTDSTEKREFTDTRENNPMPARARERQREREREKRGLAGEAKRRTSRNAGTLTHLCPQRRRRWFRTSRPRRR